VTDLSFERNRVKTFDDSFRHTDRFHPVPASHLVLNHGRDCKNSRTRLTVNILGSDKIRWLKKNHIMNDTPHSIAMLAFSKIVG